MNKILTVEQIQTMSVDEIINAYQSGYRLSENTEIYSSNNNPKYHITSLQHYTASDIGIIATAIGISVGLLGVLTWYMIKREEKRIIKEIKESVVAAVGKPMIERAIEKLAPIAERIGERLLPTKAKAKTRKQTEEL